MCTLVISWLHVVRAIGSSTGCVHVLTVILREAVNKKHRLTALRLSPNSLQIVLWPLLFAAIGCCGCELIIPSLSPHVPAVCISVQSPQLLSALSFSHQERI